MKKNTKIAIIVGLITFVIVGFLLSKLNFQGKSSVTFNNSTTVTYTGGQFNKELGDKINAFISFANLSDLSKLKASEIQAEADKALGVIDDIEKFVNGIDNFKGARGIEELKVVINKWISTNMDIYKNDYPKLADIVGEDGKVDSQLEASQANEIINSADESQEAVLKELYSALDKFAADNNSQ